MLRPGIVGPSLEEADGRVAGSYWSCAFTITTAAGVAVNIAAASAAEFYVVDEYGGTRLLSKTLGTGITVTNGAAGIITVVIAAADTIAETGLLWYEGYITVGGARRPFASNRFAHHEAAS